MTVPGRVRGSDASFELRQVASKIHQFRYSNFLSWRLMASSTASTAASCLHSTRWPFRFKCGASRSTWVSAISSTQLSESQSLFHTACVSIDFESFRFKHFRRHHYYFNLELLG